MQLPGNKNTRLKKVRYRHLFLWGIAVLLSVTSVSFASASTVHASEPTAERLQLIKGRCADLKTRLTSVQKTEAADRIKRGRSYDQDLLPYISAFNSRIATNKVDAPELIRIAADLQDVVGRAQFGSQYSIYTDDLTGAIHSDCQNTPDTMNDWLDKARIDRATLAQSVKQADTLITEYIAELEKLKARYTPVINSSAPTTTDTPGSSN